MSYDPKTGLPLIGTETLYVLGHNPAGIDAASEFKITVNDIAVLAEAGSGNVVGPGSSVNTDLAAFNGVTGKLLSDSGIATANVVQNTGGAVTSGHLAVFSGVGGRNIIDGGPVPAGSTPGPYLVRNSAAALSAATILANTAAGNNRYVLTSATGVPITLPFPTGTGTVLEFIIDLKSTSNGYVFDTGVGGAGINPFISALEGRASLTGGAISSVNVTAAGAHNRMTLLNGVAGTGGDKGDRFYITDAIAGQYQVSGLITADTTTATFSAY